eukprot:INCI773.1.p1 GENE.INCI773.1~~INCI773.1.p1  ORF type:complete len:141 (-),score=33.56 INCI773.1:718-1140(-)
MDPHAAFDLFDADQDGRITREELLKAMETIGMRPTEEQLNRLIDGADSAGNGFVSREDFVNLISRTQPVVPEADLVAAFKILSQDDENTGLVEVSVLKDVMASIGKRLDSAELEDMLHDCAPETANGKVDYRAFAKKLVS